MWYNRKKVEVATAIDRIVHVTCLCGFVEKLREGSIEDGIRDMEMSLDQNAFSLIHDWDSYNRNTKTLIADAMIRIKKYRASIGGKDEDYLTHLRPDEREKSKLWRKEFAKFIEARVAERDQQ